MAVTLLSLGGSILAASPADGQIDDTNGPIVFERGLPPAVGIGSANLDNTNRDGVIEAIEFDDRDPTVAPDGEQVAFSRNMDGNEEIFTRPLGPGEGRRLTDDPRRDLDPAWQPCQGGSIAWSRDGDIWVMNRDGSAPRQLTIGADVDEQPSWSPDCDAIVFTRAGAGLHVVN